QEKLVADSVSQYGIFKQGKDWMQYEQGAAKDDGKQAPGRWVKLSPASAEILAREQANVVRQSRPAAPGAADPHAARRQQAQAAIAAGKDPNAVRARFREMAGKDL